MPSHRRQFHFQRLAVDIVCPRPDAGGHQSELRSERPADRLIVGTDPGNATSPCPTAPPSAPPQVLSLSQRCKTSEAVCACVARTHVCVCMRCVYVSRMTLKNGSRVRARAL